MFYLIFFQLFLASNSSPVPFEEQIFQKQLQSTRKPFSTLCYIQRFKNFLLPQKRNRLLSKYLKKLPPEQARFLAPLALKTGIPRLILAQLKLNRIKKIKVKTAKTASIVYTDSHSSIPLLSIYKTNQYPLETAFDISIAQKSDISFWLRIDADWSLKTFIFKGKTNRQPIIYQGNSDWKTRKLSVHLPPGKYRFVLTFKTEPITTPWVVYQKEISSIKNKTGGFQMKVSPYSSPLQKQEEHHLLTGKFLNSNTDLLAKSVNPVLQSEFFIKNNRSPLPSLPQATSPNIRYQNLLVAAKWFLKQHRNKQAFSYYKQVQKLYPHGLKVSLEMADIQSRLGMPLTSLNTIKKLVKKYGKLPVLLEYGSYLDKNTDLNNRQWNRQLYLANKECGNCAFFHALDLLEQQKKREGCQLLAQNWKNNGHFDSLLIMDKNSCSLLAKFNFSRTQLQLNNIKHSPSANYAKFKINNPQEIFTTIIKKHRIFPEKIRKYFQQDLKTGVLADKKIIYLNHQKQRHYFHQRLLWLKNKSTLAAFKKFRVVHSEQKEKLDLVAARIYRKNGVILQSSSIKTSKVFNRKTSIYYDLTRTTINFSQARIGDIIEIAYTVKELPSSRKLKNIYFGDMLLFQEHNYDRALSEISIYHPKAFRIQTSLSGLKTIKPRTSTWKNLKIITYHGKNIKGVKNEWYMAGPGETLALVKTGLAYSWRKLGKKYHDFIKNNYHSNRQIQNLVKKLTAGTSSKQQKIKNIHRYILKNYRYISLQFGLHDYHPYKPVEILNRKFGDCKDMTLLLVLMLREAGIKALPALVRTRNWGKIAWDVPSLIPFNHAIVYLPQENKWIDGTEKYLLYPYFPSNLQNRKALVISKQGGYFKKINAPAADKNTELRQGSIKLARNGSAKIWEKIIVQGLGQKSWRFYLEHKQLPDLISNIGKITKLKTTNLENLNSPLEIKVEVSSPSLFSREKNKLIGSPGFHEKDLLKKLVTSRNRQNDLILAYRGTFTRKLQIQIPRNFKPLQKTSSWKIILPSIEVIQNIKYKNNTLYLQRTIKIKKLRIKKENYPLFATKVKQAIKKLTTNLVFSKK
ncbi:MAG: DUF3857 domain-containing protein [Deltaproteobacteria bacterium]|jgi:hypothetical protein|nr:DUF3857 domain-containing protein [Deltaproteobacteria bacterium]